MANTVEVMIGAWIGSATGVSRAMRSIPNSRYVWVRFVNPLIQAGKQNYDHARYWNEDYEKQVTLFDREVNSYYSGADVLDLIKSESSRLWKRES